MATTVHTCVCGDNRSWNAIYFCEIAVILNSKCVQIAVLSCHAGLGAVKDAVSSIRDGFEVHSLEVAATSSKYAEPFLERLRVVTVPA